MATTMDLGALPTRAQTKDFTGHELDLNPGSHIKPEASCETSTSSNMNTKGQTGSSGKDRAGSFMATLDKQLKQFSTTAPAVKSGTEEGGESQDPEAVAVPDLVTMATEMMDLPQLRGDMQEFSNVVPQPEVPVTAPPVVMPVPSAVPVTRVQENPADTLLPAPRPEGSVTILEGSPAAQTAMEGPAVTTEEVIPSVPASPLVPAVPTDVTNVLELETAPPSRPGQPQVSDPAITAAAQNPPVTRPEDIVPTERPAPTEQGRPVNAPGAMETLAAKLDPTRPQAIHLPQTPGEPDRPRDPTAPQAPQGVDLSSLQMSAANPSDLNPSSRPARKIQEDAGAGLNPVKTSSGQTETADLPGTNILKDAVKTTTAAAGEKLPDPSLALPSEGPHVTAQQPPANIPQRIEEVQGVLSERAADSTHPARSVANQILESVHSAVQGDQKTITINLTPPELGRVTLRFQEGKEGLQGELEVSRAETRYDVERALPQIVQNLQANGIQVRRIEVHVQLNDSQHADHPEDLLDEHQRHAGDPRQQDDSTGGQSAQSDETAAQRYFGGQSSSNDPDHPSSFDTDSIDMLV